MELWSKWLMIVMELRPAFSRTIPFLWFTVCLFGFSIRTDLLGVTSIVRAVGLKTKYYDRLLDFFHSTSVCPDRLAELWVSVVFKYFPSLITFNGRYVAVGDGIKIPKSGNKMPGVKYLHQQSESNTKPEYIMGHSFQAIGILCGTLKGVFSIPLISRIHEGVRFSPKDKRTLLDKMVEMVNGLHISLPCFLVADAYYAGRKIVNGLLDMGWHLVTRVRSNAVAYFPPHPDSQPKGRGRKKTYGEKVELRSFFAMTDEMTEVKSPVYGERDISIRYFCVDLLWRPVARMVRFVIVFHPIRGKIILLSTDLSLAAEDIIKIYGYRFKIEISFKQILRIIGGYAYHFWIRDMVPVKKKSGDTYLHRKDEQYRKKVKRKINAYHLYVQTGIIAQGMMMYLAVYCPALVWKNFGSWLRTMNTDSSPSELVTSYALRNTFIEFLLNLKNVPILKKFLFDKIDIPSKEELDLAA